MNNVCLCEKTSRCQKTTNWTSIEKELKQIFQQVFESVGIGAGEKTYHDAVFAQLCLLKHCFECSHIKCTLHTETVAPIFSSRTNEIPCGFMRSDIILCWQTVSKKRKISDCQKTFKCVIELKSTASSLNSSAILQLLCYMKSYRAQKGLVCNFLQKSDQVQNELAKQPNQICFTIDGNNIISLVDSANQIATIISPTVEIQSVQLTHTDG